MSGRARAGALRALPTTDAPAAARGRAAVHPLVVPPAPTPGPDVDPDRDWRRDAACTAVDPELFFPLEYRQEDQVRPARRVCGRCPVRARCLADVMSTEDPARRHGVCGGTTPQERTALFRAGLTVTPTSGGAA